MKPGVKKLIWLLALILGVYVAFLTIGFVNSHTGTTINAQVIPGDARVQIDDKKPGRVGVIKTDPGEHTLTITRNDFKTLTIKVTVDEKQHKTIHQMLAPANAAGNAWVKAHPKLVAQGEGFAGKEFNASSDAALQKAPITKKLPFIDREYRIDYGRSVAHPDDPTATAIFITSLTEQSKADALALIKYWGYDPAKLEIVYKSFTP